MDNVDKIAKGEPPVDARRDGEGVPQVGRQVTAPPWSTPAALIPFVPSGPDFEQALAFFAELGFAAQWRNGGLAGLRFGAAAFMLQDIDVPEWQKNQMLTLEVDDLDAYWTTIAGKRLETRFAGVRLKEPTDYPWGREVHIIDPGRRLLARAPGARPPNPQPIPQEKRRTRPWPPIRRTRSSSRRPRAASSSSCAPTSRPSTSSASSSWRAKASTTASPFHRVIDGFMAQTGCPKGTGTGGSKLSQPQGRVQRRAARARRVLDGALVVARQRQQPVLHRASTTPRFLDKQYTVWGKVIEGMENVDKIKRGEPVRDPDKMVSVKVGADA